eukprot:3121593-Amphidinium_carterae.2
MDSEAFTLSENWSLVGSGSNADAAFEIFQAWLQMECPDSEFQLSAVELRQKVRVLLLLAQTVPHDTIAEGVQVQEIPVDEKNRVRIRCVARVWVLESRHIFAG